MGACAGDATDLTHQRGSRPARSAPRVVDATSDNISFYAEPAELAASAVDDSESSVRLLSVPDVGCKLGLPAGCPGGTALSLFLFQCGSNTPFYLGEEGVTLYTNVALCLLQNTWMAGSSFA